jgi:hypothetical protein
MQAAIRCKQASRAEKKLELNELAWVRCSSVRLGLVWRLERAWVVPVFVHAFLDMDLTVNIIMSC